MNYFRCLAGILLGLVIGAFLLLAPAGTAQAVTMKMELRELAGGADAIVTGTVVERESRWNAERTHIFTTLSVSVEDVLKGEPCRRVITIDTPGGEVDGIGELVSDTPVFNRGEQAVLFLKHSSDSTAYEFYGGTGGKLSVNEGRVGRLPLSEFKKRVDESLQGKPLSLEASEEVYATGDPAITGIDPGSASAGTGSLVTITGSEFGDAQGQVYFFYRSGQSYIAGIVSSWSDTEIIVAVPTGIISGYPASASSGPVFVRTQAGLDSAQYPFAVTFSYGGCKWPGDNPSVSYRINPNTSDSADEAAAVQSAAGTWNAVSNKSFSFVYAGTTSATSSGYDGVNEVLWANLGSTSGILARTTYWYIDETIVETDLVFNDYYTWETSSGYNFDIQSVALHELGHFLNLRDLYGAVDGYPSDTGKVMYGFKSAGVTTRNLSAGDQAGIRWIYPGENMVTLSVSPSEVNLNTGGTQALTVTVNPSDAAVEYVSNTPGVAGVSADGLISAVTAGSAEITVTAVKDGYTDATPVVVPVNVAALPVLSISATDPGAAEPGADTGVFTVSRTGSTEQPLTVAYAVYGTATNGVDYNSLPGSVTVLAGEASTVITVAPIDDTVVEGSETVVLELAGSAAYDIGLPGSATVTVDDNDNVNPIAVTISSPNGGEVLTAGTSHNITWNYTGGCSSSIRISLYKGGAYNCLIASNVSAAAGSYSWAIPGALGAGEDYRVRVTCNSDTNVYDLSDTSFTIGSPIAITSPNGGEVWVAGTSQDITWNYTGGCSSSIRISLYKGGAYNCLIASNVSAAAGSYSWAIPGALGAGEDYRVRVTCNSDTNVYDLSDTSFTIGSPITVTSPNGGEVWVAGTSHTITWNYTGGCSSDVRISLYKGGAYKCLIASNVSAGAGSYSWAIPGALTAGEDYRARVTCNSDTNVYDLSTNFAIGSPITVTSPNGGEVLAAGASYDITWDYTGGCSSDVRISLYKGGVYQCQIASNVSVAAGSYSWSIPATLVAGGDYKIRVTCNADSNVYDLSDLNYSISRA